MELMLALFLAGCVYGARRAMRAAYLRREARVRAELAAWNHWMESMR